MISQLIISDGTVKVLPFGLAKAIPGFPGDCALSMTPR